MSKSKGRVTVPTDFDVVPQTLAILEKWGADAVRDCDGTGFPQELWDSGAKVYATYYTTRKDNAWAKAHPREIQQCYIMTGFHTAANSAPLTIPLMEGYSRELLAVNADDDIKRWWEVIDRTTGAALAGGDWQYDADAQAVKIPAPAYCHEYTVSFLAYLVWDPVHMYNALVNNWQDFEKQITFDVRQPETKEYSKKRLRAFLQEHSYVDVVRFTTFFHQFTLLFDALRRDKYVDWYGYSASVSPYILEKFEKEVGYPFRPEYIIDQGYYNNQYRIPAKEYLDFMAFQRREVAALAKELVDIVHAHGKEAMMFLGDHWIGTEPFMPEFKTIGLDAVVGSVGNGSTLRLIADIEGVRYTEGRLLPYFFPDTFHEGGTPAEEAQANWLQARRAILRSPVDRIGYGGYLKLALDFPDFVDYVEKICDEFRDLYDNIKGTTPYCVKTVAVLNAWGTARAWGPHMVHHALYHKQNHSYAGVVEALAGAPFAVKFISFDDLLRTPGVLDDVDVLLNVGGAYTAHSGGDWWQNPQILSCVRAFIHEGKGFIGIGEPSACQHQGHYFQLAAALGVEKENGFTLGYAKHNTEVKPHFITAEGLAPDFGEGMDNVYALEGADILAADARGVQMAASGYGRGRCVYLSGLPYSIGNTRLLYRAVLWACGSEGETERWYTSNSAIELNAYPAGGKYCLVNNTPAAQTSKVWAGGKAFEVALGPGEIRWYARQD